MAIGSHYFVPSTKAQENSLLARVYQRMTTSTSIVFTSEMDEITTTIEGADPKSLEYFFKGFNKKRIDWIIPARTFQHRLSKGQRLTTDETSKFVRAAHIIALAEEIFDNKEKALSWLDRPSLTFNGKSPHELMQTEFGARMLEDALHRIDEGYVA